VIVRALRLVGVAAVALALLLAPQPATAEPTPPPTSTVGANESVAAGHAVIADGHVDMGPHLVNGSWTIQVRDDSVRPPVWRALSDVVLQANDAAKVTVPANDAFAFLGKPGDPVWLLPQVQKAGILWPGWNTQDPSVVTSIRREVTWRLHGVDGPGHFVLFLNGNFGAPEIVFDGTLPFPQETGIEANSHVHGNWAFSAPGAYRLDVEMSATTADGKNVTSRDTLRVFVGGGDATVAFAAATPSPAVATTASSGPAAPVPSDAASAPTTGNGLMWWIAVLLAIVAIGVIVWTLARRRRGTSQDGEPST
jgi:putative ABC transporter-associated repeat protein